MRDAGAPGVEGPFEAGCGGEALLGCLLGDSLSRNSFNVGSRSLYGSLGLADESPEPHSQPISAIYITCASRRRLMLPWPCGELGSFEMSCIKLA